LGHVPLLQDVELDEASHSFFTLRVLRKLLSVLAWQKMLS
jgi:hypothetical protein